jgi:hypothetical protein
MARNRIRGLIAACLTALFTLVLSAPAFAQYPGGETPPPTVGGERFFRGDEGLGRTGTDVLFLLALALVLLFVGLVVYGITRRSREREA